MKKMVILNSEELEHIDEALNEILKAAMNADCYPETGYILERIGHIADIITPSEDKEKDVGCWIYGRKETLSKLVKDCFEANLAFENKKKIEELEKQLNELRDADKTKGDIGFVEKELTKKMYDNGYITYNDFREAIGIPPVKRPSARTVFSSLSPEDVEETLFDHEARLNHVDECMAKLEKLEREYKERLKDIDERLEILYNNGYDKNGISRIDNLEKSIDEISNAVAKQYDNKINQICAELMALRDGTCVYLKSKIKNMDEQLELIYNDIHDENGRNRIDKLEKVVTDIPKTMGKITEKMEANDDDKDKDLSSFSVNLYWNYDSQGEDED